MGGFLSTNSPVVCPEQIETELKEFERKRLEAKDLEAAQLCMALVLRNQQPGRAVTIPIEDGEIAPLPNDLEKGAPRNSIAPLQPIAKELKPQAQPRV